jgi:autotransporter-associated beta strand protein
VAGAGGITKAGAGLMEVTGANTYSGGTVVSAGTLSVSGASATLGTGNVAVLGTVAGTNLQIQSGVSNSINDGATLTLSGGGVEGLSDQGYIQLSGGIIESVHALSLNGILQAVGTYGATGSGATNVMDDFFSGAGMLSVVALAGDYNVDGIVDSADYVMWRANVGQPAGTLLNDSTGAVVGNAQFDLWRTNFGNQLAGSSGSQVNQAAVPEPSSIGLMMFVVAAFARRRRGR